MSKTLLAKIRRPTPSDFENQCCKLFALHFNGPDMARNSEWDQRACDIIGYKDSDLDHPVGIQCRAEPAVTELEIRRDFYDAKTYRPRLKEWVVATTAPSSSRWKQLADTLTLASSPNPAERIAVRILSWTEMEQLILENPASIAHFAPVFRQF